MSEKDLNQEMVKCSHCENGTQYLSNYVSQECDYCDGNGLVKTKMCKEDKITIFIGRLKKIGIEVKLGGNYPWIYIEYINGKRVTETFQANHGFTVAFTPIKKGQEIEFTDITEIFKLIKNYCI